MDNEASEDILETVLTQNVAFSPPPSRRQSALVTNTDHLNDPQAASSSPAMNLTDLGASVGSNDSWKAEYESQLENWRAEAAEAREKAERERQRWEALRAEERLKGSTEEAGWESVGQKAPVSQLPAQDVSQSSSHSRQDTGEDSQKWEDIPSSITSSYPSMSFPENIDTPPEVPAPAPPATPSVTLSIFDSSLSTRTRLQALLSSLTINLLLPFVNGVMLGFGEIFAKNVVLGWMGWKSTPVVSSVGLNSRSFRR
ncbi:hypothetical protein C8J56DRAFT_490119 [Mycena floridula]|nr:hypothetical protein C8J56DRAFT_490119 [Mycena floridula]